MQTLLSYHHMNMIFGQVREVRALAVKARAVRALAVKARAVRALAGTVHSRESRRREKQRTTSFLPLARISLTVNTMTHFMNILRFPQHPLLHFFPPLLPLYLFPSPHHLHLLSEIASSA